MNRREFVLLAAFAWACPAHGEDMLLFSNAVGGIAAMTDQKCRSGGNVVNSTNSLGVVTLRGCFTFVTDYLVKAVWDDGTESYVNLGLGTPTEAFNRRLREEMAKAKAPAKRAVR